MRILTIEDNEEFYHSYLLRMFSSLLPVEKLQFTHYARVAEALDPLLLQEWDVILMDQELPDSVNVALEEGKQLVVRNGNMLVRLRREAEQQGRIRPSPIIGIASSSAGNHLLRAAGANQAFLKLLVPDIAKCIKTHIEKS